jgi:hypothetical protein
MLWGSLDNYLFWQPWQPTLNKFVKNLRNEKLTQIYFKIID